MLNYQKELVLRREADDPWKALANAVVEQAADDYRRAMQRKLSHGLSMSRIELLNLDSTITDVRTFFEGDWGFLLSHGLAPVIWEKLQAEFATELARFELCLPFMVKHREKLKKKKARQERRWRNNKARRKRQNKRRKGNKQE